MTEVLTRKQEITQAAAELFQKKGYPSTSMRDLAAKVGLEPSSIYSHIKSKEDLLSDICMNCAFEFSKGMQWVLNTKSSPTVKLELLIDLHLKMAIDNPSSVTVFNDEWRFLSPDVKEEFLELRKSYESLFKNILLEGRESKRFSINNVDIVFELIIQTMTIFYKSAKKHPKEELKRQVTHFIKEAIRQKLEVRN